MRKLLRFADLKRSGRVNNRETLRRWIKAGLFPRPVQIGPNSVGWWEDELEAFDATLPRAGSEKQQEDGNAPAAA